MSNKEIYKKTLTFSVHRLLFNTICVLGIAILGVGGFILVDNLTNKGLIGLAVGVVFGIILVAVISHFVSYTYQAGQIAMMTRALTEGDLPEDVYGEGKKVVKSRFTTVALYYAATRAIKAIFQELGHLITKAGEAIGGDAGSTVGSAISIGIQVVVGFLCDCCLGWIFYRSDQGAVKSTLQGAAIFFKNGKALLRNVGRIFGMGLVSLAVIGGTFFGVFFLIFSNMTDAFTSLRDEILEAGARMNTSIPSFFQNPTNLALIAAIILAFIIWSIIHGAFVRPFILVGVLRNFTQVGMSTETTENDYESITKKSKKFAKLREAEKF